TGMTGDLVAMQDIFVFEKLGIDAGGRVLGRFKATGVSPKFADKLKVSGIHLPPAPLSTRLRSKSEHTHVDHNRIPDHRVGSLRHGRIFYRAFRNRQANSPAPERVGPALPGARSRRRNRQAGYLQPNRHPRSPAAQSCDHPEAAVDAGPGEAALDNWP